MRMNVDETGRECQRTAGNALVCVTLGKITDCDDSSVGDADVGGERRGAGPVEHGRPFEDSPEHRLSYPPLGTG